MKPGGNDNSEIPRRRGERTTQQDRKTIKTRRPARFVHTSRHVGSDEDAMHTGNETTESWTYQGGATSVKRIGKSFQRVFSHREKDGTDGEQQ